MKKLKLVVLIFLLGNVFIAAQKPPLDNKVYDGWKSLSAPKISDDGKWVTYIISPQQGDGWLYIYNVSTGKKDSVARGSNASFSNDSKYLVYQVNPGYSEIRQSKKKKLKEAEMPKNNLEIRLLINYDKINIDRVKSFSLAEKNSFWMAYILEKPISAVKPEKSVSDTLKALSSKTAKKSKAPESKGSELVILNPLNKKEFKYQDVNEYVVAKDGKTISFIQCIPDSSKVDNFKIIVFDTQQETEKVVFEGKGSAKKITTNRIGDRLSFIYSGDTSKIKVYDLWAAKYPENAFKIPSATKSNIPIGWTVSENGNISFSDDGTRIFFGTAKRPEKEPADTLLDEEKFKLDIWSWNDDLLQPMQKKQLDQEKKRTYQAVYHLDNGSLFQLADTVITSVRISRKGNKPVEIGTSDLRYRRSASWTGNSGEDYYYVNIETGTKTMALENCSSRAYLSPSCNFLLYWDNEEKAWISLSVSGGVRKNLTTSIQVPLYNELNDVPDYPSPHGMAGWIDDDKHVLVYDRFDIWYLDLTGNEIPVNISNQFGRKNNMRLRYNKLDPEADYISKNEKMLLSAFNYKNKESGFYTLKPDKASNPEVLLMDKASFPGEIIKAKNADLLLWQKGNFINSPELYLSNMRMELPRKISLTNPQQNSYNWGSAELFEWMSFDRQMLQGILYKPEDFDPSRKYPMIVYFYEKSSDGLYNYMPPAPSASIINRTFAVSNGYFIFVPDITYKIGYPGQSCYNAVISGTSAILERYNFIDKNRLALDGQSWGGYQIAWLVTQTDLFACAYAGAPVSNMTSAYGGIRWESGMSRMFQYEHTQSRIGGTLWDNPVQFIENSPIFFVPKINTPLLLMANDADGAVPWYQGIEFITALRRLDKPAWLLSYNDEAHNLVRRANRKDISIRKMQFFDHYLKGAPIPYWMKYGISQIDKGNIDGYDLIKE